MTEIIPDRCSPAWAHAAGIIDLQPVAEVPRDFTAIADRVMIQETLARYVMAYDERRLDILESVYTEDGSYSYQIGDGPVDGRSERGALIAWLGEIMQSQTDQRRHMLSSLVIEELNPEKAVVIAYKAICSAEDTVQLITTGLYRFTLVKRDHRWRIREAHNAMDRPF